MCETYLQQRCVHGVHEMLTSCSMCPCAQTVEGIVVDVGWYRTTIRSFEREIFNIPNSVFSRNVVLNITRKQKEWRFYEFIGAAWLPALALQMVLCACWVIFYLNG